jgi:hypothetical protein
MQGPTSLNAERIEKQAHLAPLVIRDAVGTVPVACDHRRRHAYFVAEARFRPGPGPRCPEALTATRTLL